MSKYLDLVGLLNYTEKLKSYIDENSVQSISDDFINNLPAPKVLTFDNVEIPVKIQDHTWSGGAITIESVYIKRSDLPEIPANIEKLWVVNYINNISYLSKYEPIYSEGFEPYTTDLTANIYWDYEDNNITGIPVIFYDSDASIDLWYIDGNIILNGKLIIE